MVGKTGVPFRHAATPNQMRNPTFAESKCSNTHTACTHSTDACKKPASFSAGSYRTAEQLRKSRYMGKGREKEEASKQARRIYAISRLFFNIPTSSPRVPVNSLGTGGFDLCSPCCYKQHILSNTGLVCATPLLNTGRPLRIFVHYFELFLYFSFLGRTHWQQQNIVKYLPAVSRLCQVRLCIFFSLF